MGYTHYWHQSRDFTKAEWAQVCEDIAALLKDVQHVQGIPIGDGEGNPGTSPAISADSIWFNGIGDDSHETFAINRKRPAKESWQRQRGNDFCKTARKPYDVAVTAILCYLASVPGNAEPFKSPLYTVSSDGHGHEWLDGLAEARRALPRYANILDIPMDILKSDRWCMPWVSCREESGYSVDFCVNGKGYVSKLETGEYYCFSTHLALAKFLENTKRAEFSARIKVEFFGRVYDEGRIENNIWNATGSFNAARHRRIAKRQAEVLSRLFPADAAHALAPPAYMRPGEMPEPATRAYRFDELLKELAA